jgi:F0F1-type ATP synthase assembly protein I
MALNKQELYKWTKIAGALSFIPFVLIAGISAGYFIGGLLVRKFNAAPVTMPVAVVTGIFVSAVEVIRIVRLVLKIDRQDKARV